MRNGLNATSGDSFAVLPLVNKVLRSAHAIDSIVALSLLSLPMVPI